jgi:hypothetical protein
MSGVNHATLVILGGSNGEGRGTKNASAKKAGKLAKRALDEVAQLDFFARFRSAPDEPEIDFPIDIGHDTVWATQAQMRFRRFLAE